MRTMNSVIKDCTESYLDSINPDEIPSPSEVEEELISTINDQISLENQVRSKDEKLKLLKTLCPSQIGDILLKFYNIVNLNYVSLNNKAEEDVLAIYQDTGKNEGLYLCDEALIKGLAAKYNYTISEKELCEVAYYLKRKARRVVRTIDVDLIPVNNGIFDFRTKELLPFSPDYVFLSKSRVNYNPAATNVVLANDKGETWDVVSWIDDLSDDKEIVQLIWELLSAIVRPYVKWNKVAWLYSEKGNNGKGTLCELMRNLCGEGSYASIPVAQFSKNFLLEPLIYVNSVIVDENDVGDFVDKAADFKAVITNDPISINIKYKTPVTYTFPGMVIQCCNDHVRFKDKSPSLMRRQLIIPFEKSFKGIERKEIKSVYLKDERVLEYVLYRVLHMNFYELSEPEACRIALEEYKEFNDPVRQFWNELREEFAWTLLPYAFLYDLYKSWMFKNVPTGSKVTSNTFIKNIRTIIDEDNEWDVVDKTRAAGRMDNPEPLIATYDLVDWKNPNYTGGNTDKMCTPQLKESYRGLLRK